QRSLPSGDDLARERQRDARAGVGIRCRVPRRDAQAERVRERPRDSIGPRAAPGGGGMTLAIERDQGFLDAIRRIADEVAAPHADDVDRSARFPVETIEALKTEGALGALIPTELGGGGESLETVADACFELGRRCGASAMVFAMHQIQIAAIVRHLDGAPWFEAYLRDVAEGQRLVASVTSEIGTGGDLGRSIAAVTPVRDGIVSFEKQAPTVSYGSYADDLLTTLRRSPDAEPGDQVVALTSRDQHRLESTSTWDPPGRRAT